MKLLLILLAVSWISAAFGFFMGAWWQATHSKDADTSERTKAASVRQMIDRIKNS